MIPPAIRPEGLPCPRVEVDETQGSMTQLEKTPPATASTGETDGGFFDKPYPHLQIHIYIHTPESCQLVPQDNKQGTPQFEPRDEGTLAEKFCERFPGLCDLFEDYPGFGW